MATHDALQKPPSSSHFLLNCLSCVIFFGGVYFLHHLDPDYYGSMELHAGFVLLALLPQIIRDVILQRRIGAFKTKHKFDAKRVMIKLTGLYATFAFIGFLYWLLPEYSKPFFNKYFQSLEVVLPFLMGLAIPYFLWFDPRMENPKDGYWHMGMLATGKWSEIDRRYIWEHLKSWIVKGFFMPLMLTYAMGNIEMFFNFDPTTGFFIHFYDFSYHFIFTVDLLFATFGYMMTFKALNTQIFSAEPTVLGWVVCLMGYAPYWENLFYPAYFNYDDNIAWMDMVRTDHELMIFWGWLIIACITIYTLATISFGYRFSNLTYRGIITSGPYRFCKHPAYVFKNISWWLVSVPFLTNADWSEALRHCILLFGVNCIYYTRARTEENHLSNYPEYVAYAEWMNDHSIFRWVPKFLPFVRYSRERCLRSGSRVYAPFAAVPVTEQAIKK